jgi:hypothetical protein
MADATDSPELGGPAFAESGRPAGRAPAGKTRLGRGWLRYRAWRRSRPFWAGIWLIIAGAELLLIPLPIRNMGIILHIGIGGISGILIGAVLILLGLLLWFSPGQRVFYSTVAVLLAVAALVASNLGGFLIGTLFGVIGGSLGFGWMPGRPKRRRRRRHQPDVPDGGPAIQGVAPGAEHGSILPGLVLLPALALGGLVHLSPATLTAADPSASASASPSSSVPASPSTSAPASPSAPAPASPSAPAPPAPSAPASASSSTSGPASPGTSASPEPSTSAGSGSSATSSTSPTPSPSSTPTGAPPPFAVSTAQSTLTASSASLTGFAYDGVVSVPTASGSVQMMEFSATSIDLSGAQLAVSEGGVTMTTSASMLHYVGNVVLYATELSGSLLGTPITITPSTPLATILQSLGQADATQPLPLQVTNMTTRQLYTSASALTADSLQIS